MSSAGRTAQAVVAACLLLLGLGFGARAQSPSLVYECFQTASGCGNVTTANGLPVQIVSGGGTGGTASTFGATFPGIGTAIGAKNGANMVNLAADGSSNLLINCAVGCAGGTASNATSGVATSSTNGTMDAWLYGFNGTTWDQLQVDASKNLKVLINAAIPTGANTIGAVTQASGPWSNNITQVAGASIQQGHGVAASAIRVELPTDGTGVVGLIAGTNTIGNIGQTSQYPNGAVPITASATGTTAATTATLAASASIKTYVCGFSIRANATAAATANATVTGTVTGTLNYTQWTAPLASGLGITEQVFMPCVPSSAINTAIAVISAAPGTGGVVSVTAWGYQL